MPTEMERLVVTLEASIKQYERALAKANGTTISTLRKIENNVAKSEKRQSAIIARMGAQLQGSVASFLPAVSGVTGAAGIATAAIVGLGYAIADTVKAAAELGDLAEDLGISTDFTQAWQKEIVKTGASIEDANRALFEMVKEINDADSPMRKLFDANKVSIQGKSIEEVIKLYIEMVSRIENASDRVAVLSDTLGAKLARKMSEGFREGTAGIIESQNKIAAGTEGWTEEQIKDAQRIETEWNAMWHRISTAWHGIILDMISAWKKGFTEQMIASNAEAKSAAMMAWEGFRDWFKTNIGDLPSMPAMGSPGQAFGRGGPRGPQRPYVAPGYPSSQAPSSAHGQNLAYLAAHGGANARMAGLNPDFAARLVRAMRAAEAATGAPAMLSGFPSSLARSRADQERIWRESGGGKLYAAARPGFSRHERGEAADLASGPARAWIRANAKAFGLTHLTGNYDLPHIQMARDQAGGIGAALPDKIVAPPDDAKSKQKTNEKIQDRIKLTETLIEKEAALKDQARLTEDTYEKNIEADIAGLQELNDIAADAFGGLINDLMNGVKAGEAFNNMLKRMAANLAQMAIQQIFSGGGAPGGLFGALFGGGSGVAAQGIPGLPGLQHGGRFKVKGAGGTDSQVVAFRATPGEEVNVTPRGLRRSGAGAPSIALGGATINIAGNADERTLAEMDRKLAKHAVAQRKALERDWGVLSLRYSRLRAP